MNVGISACPKNHFTAYHVESLIINDALDELGNWRPERNMFTRRYFQTYLSHIPISKPEEDFDDRNALYGL